MDQKATPLVSVDSFEQMTWQANPNDLAACAAKMEST